tara:strand:+ start:2678 stop:3802 length:1125 start_codon:yes stop_codon:yes gene_type:complete
MNKVVIAGYCRSPFTPAKKGELINVKPDILLSEVIKNLISKTKVNTEEIEDVIIGCAFPEGEQGFNIGKIVTFLSGMNIKTAGMTVNRWCGSSMQAIHIAAGAISMGSGKAFICGGVESMSRVTTGFEPLPYPKSQSDNPHLYMSMGLTAENVAKKYNLSRLQQQDFAISSHAKANIANNQGKFKEEIFSINGCSKDGAIRPNTDQQTLDKLKLAFNEKGTVTAGTSSPLTDGAAVTLICEEQFAKDNNLDILARIVSTSVDGCDPDLMGLGPIGATKKALKRANLTIKDIDVIELNEAFASQSLACINDLNIDVKKVNLDGGAIALGHPLGATGARITGKAAQLLRRENKKYALSTQCIGLGMGIATILETTS